MTSPQIHAVDKAILDKVRKVIKEEALVTKDQAMIVINNNGAMGNWLFDFRNIFLKAEVLRELATIFWTVHKKDYPFQVGGMESAAIPFVTAIVLVGKELGMPVNGFYIRKSRKKVGLMKQVEGYLGNDKIILVDDLINSGSSFIKQIEVLEDLGKKVSSIFAIVQFRDTDTYKYFHNKNIDIVSLFPLSDFNLTYNVDNKPDPFYLSKVWQFRSQLSNLYKIEKKSTPVLDEEKIYFGTDKGLVYALNQETGALAWKFQVGVRPRGNQIISDIVLHEKSIFFASYNGNIISLNTESGIINWVFSDADWVGSSPVLSPKDGTLYIGLNKGWFNKKKNFIYALDMKSGKLKWNAEVSGFIHGGIAVNNKGDLILVGSEDGTVTIFHKSGHKEWEARVGSIVSGSFAFDETGRFAYFGAGGGFYKIGLETRVVERIFLADANIVTTPIIYKNKIIFSSLDKSIYCLDISTHKEVWRFRTMGRVFASPVVYNDLILVGSNDARLYSIDPTTGNALGFFQIPERITNPVVFNKNSGKIFLTTFANELYCLLLKTS